MDRVKKFNYVQKGWSRRYFARPFVFKRDIGEYYCLICDCFIYAYSSVVDHILGKRHASSLELYGGDVSFLGDDHYYCGRCDCVVPYCTNVYNHVTGKRHRSLMSKNAWCVDWNLHESFVCPFVLSESFDNYYCLVCGCYMSGFSAYESHVRGKLHASVVETFGRRVFPLGDDYYYCAQCDCVVPHYRNVHGHIIGRRHEILSEQTREQPDRPSNCNNEKKTRKLSILSGKDNRRSRKKTNITRRSIDLSKDLCDDFAKPSQKDLSEATNKQVDCNFGCEDAEEPEETQVQSSVESPIFSEESFRLFVEKYKLLLELEDADHPQVRKMKTHTPKSAPFTEHVWNWFVDREDSSCGRNDEEKTKGKNVDETFEGTILPLGDDYYCCDQCDCIVRHYGNICGHIVERKHEESARKNEQSARRVDSKEEKNNRRFGRARSLENLEISKLPAFSEYTENFIEAKKQTNLDEFSSHKYTIFSRSAGNETKKSREDSMCEKNSKYAESRMRLNLSSWQLSCCNNALRHPNLRNETKNLPPKNSKRIVKMREPVDDEARSRKHIVFAQKNGKYSRYLTITDKDSSTEKNSLDISMNDLEIFSITSSHSSESFDVNSNERSNFAPMNYRPERAAGNLSFETMIDDDSTSAADPVVREFALNTNDLDSNIPISRWSNDHVDEDSSSPRSTSSANEKKRSEFSGKFARSFVQSSYVDDTRLSFVIDSKKYLLPRLSQDIFDD